jgi:hypothetical protein
MNFDHNLPVSTIIINGILKLNFSKRYNHIFSKQSVDALISFFKIAEKSINIIDVDGSVNNPEFFSFLLPYLNITSDCWKHFVHILTPEILELIWEYYDQKIDNSFVDTFDYHQLTHEIIKWFKQKEITLNSISILEKIMMSYLTCNKLNSFFVDFECELVKLKQCNKQLFATNTRLSLFPLSPQMLISFEKSGYVSHNFLERFNV